MIIFDPSGASARMTSTSGVTTTFLKRFFSSDCFSFCCVSRVTAASVGVDKFVVWAVVGDASSKNEAKMAWRGLHLMLLCCGYLNQR